MAIYDQFGNKVDTGLLDDEISGAQPIVRDVWTESVAGSIKPDKLAYILQAAKEGDSDAFFTLADEMEEREMHYGSVLSTRKLGIQGLDVQVVPASDDARDVEIADAVREIANTPNFSDMIESLTDGFAKGFSACEIIWKMDSKHWLPVKFPWRDPRWFYIDILEGEEIRLKTEADMVRGETLAPFKFILHKPQLKKGLTVASGLARMAAVSFMCKSYVVRDWMRFIQNYGLPFRIGRYDRQSASENDVRVLKRAVSMIGSDSAAILPEGVRIEFVKDATNGKAGDATFERIANWMDSQVSKRVLGQTMTTDDGSSNAQAQVHDEVRSDIKCADAKKIENTINRDLVKPYVDLNWGEQKRYPRVKFIIEDKADIAAISEALGKLVPLGLRVDQTEVRGILGLKTPEKDAEVLQAGQTAQAEKPEAANHQRALNRELRDELEAIAADEMGDWKRQMNPVIDPLRKLLDETESYDEFIERLPELLDQMDNTEIVEALARATFKARGLGDAQDAV